MDHIDQRFLTDLSEDYVGLKYRQLRMLLHGIIFIGCLEVSTTGLELFNELVERGKISKTNVSLLSDVAEVTEQTSAKHRIAEYKSTIQCSETGTRLTPYRKALFEALMNVGRDDLLKVIGFYTLKHHGFDNIWDVVFHLEKQELLDDTHEKIERFAKLLNKKTGSKLLAAASKTLTIRGATAPSPQADLNERLAPSPSQDIQHELRRIKENITKESDVGRMTWLWISLIVGALVAIAIQQSVIEPTTKPVGETTTTLTAPSKDGQKEEPREMKGNNRHERSTDPARERTISSKGTISNDFSHSITYAGWKHYRDANWERHNKMIIFDYNLGERYSGSDNYYIYVAKSDKQFSEGYLDSPEIPDEWDDVCLKFDYYISNEISEIDVDHIVNGEQKMGFNSPGRFVHKQWTSADVPINTVDINNSYFRFGGKVYGSGKQIVVIDNIVISEGEC